MYLDVFTKRLALLCKNLCLFLCNGTSTPGCGEKCGSRTLHSILLFSSSQLRMSPYQFCCVNGDLSPNSQKNRQSRMRQSSTPAKRRPPAASTGSIPSASTRRGDLPGRGVGGALLRLGRPARAPLQRRCRSAASEKREKGQRRGDRLVRRGRGRAAACSGGWMCRSAGGVRRGRSCCSAAGEKGDKGRRRGERLVRRGRSNGGVVGRLWREAKRGACMWRGR